MRFPSSNSAINTVILVLMAVAWLYTEVSEHLARDDFKQTVYDFMVEIEHDRLLERVQDLEAREREE